MLFYNTIERSTLELLKAIQADPVFSSLRLVGGTSLALQIGHRKSVDLDFFGKLNVDGLSLNQHLGDIGELKILKQSENIHIFTLNGIKVDFVNYPYPWIRNPIFLDGITLADIEDIIPMKLSAITNRGTKKDFVDIYYLMKKYTLSGMLRLYNDKYADGSVFLVLKSLSYFEDADVDEDPFLVESIEWEAVKSTIQRLVEDYSLLE